ncbi:MAG: flagellin [Candidatus Anammoxibacter sp.]
MSIGISSSSSTNNTLSSLNNINRAVSTNIRKLSAGLRITRAADDAAGAAISAKLEAEIAAIEQAGKNVANGQSLLSTAEGGLNNISDMLLRARELAVQSADGSLSNSDRQIVNREFGSIVDEITRVADTTEFNGKKLLNGDLSASAINQTDIQASPSSSSSDKINLNVIEGVTASQLGIEGTDVATANNAQDAITAIDAAIDKVSITRAEVGATQNRLSASTAGNLETARINLASANSTIKDLDVSSEISKFRQNQVIQAVAIKVTKLANDNNSKLIGSVLNVKV